MAKIIAILGKKLQKTGNGKDKDKGPGLDLDQLARETLTQEWYLRFLDNTLEELAIPKINLYLSQALTLEALYTSLIDELQGKCCLYIENDKVYVIKIRISDIEQAVKEQLGAHVCCPQSVKEACFSDKLHQETDFFVKKTLNEIAQTVIKTYSPDVFFDQLIYSYLGKFCLNEQGKMFQINVKDLEIAVQKNLSDPSFKCTSDVTAILSQRANDIIASENGFLKSITEYSIGQTLSLMGDVERKRYKHHVNKDNAHLKWNYRTQEAKHWKKFTCSLQFVNDIPNISSLNQNVLFFCPNAIHYFSLTDKEITPIKITDFNKSAIEELQKLNCTKSASQKELDLVNIVIGKYKDTLHGSKTPATLLPTETQYTKFYYSSGAVGLLVNFKNCYTDNNKYSFLENALTNFNYHYNTTSPPSNNILYASADRIREKNRKNVTNKNCTEWNEIRAAFPKQGIETVIALSDTPKDRLIALKTILLIREEFQHDYNLPIKIYSLNAPLKAYTVAQMQSDIAANPDWVNKNPLYFHLNIPISKTELNKLLAEYILDLINKYSSNDKAKGLAAVECLIAKGAELTPSLLEKALAFPMLITLFLGKNIYAQPDLDSLFSKYIKGMDSHYNFNGKPDDKKVYLEQTFAVFESLLAKGAKFDDETLEAATYKHYPELISFLFSKGLNNIGNPSFHIDTTDVDCSFANLSNLTFYTCQLCASTSLIGATIDKKTLDANKFRDFELKSIKKKLIGDYTNYLNGCDSFDKVITILKHILDNPQDLLKLRLEGLGSSYGKTESLAVVINLGRRQLFTLAKEAYESGNPIDTTTYEADLRKIFTADIYSYGRKHVFFLGKKTDNAPAVLEYILDPQNHLDVEGYDFLTKASVKAMQLVS